MNLLRVCLVTMAAALLASLPLGAGQGPLDPAVLLKPPTDAWPSYHGDYTGRHYSPLRQVTTANARNLSLAWLYRTPASTDGAVLGGPPVVPAAGPGRGGGAPALTSGPIVKAMPLMVHGILYLSTPNRVFAVDARTGRQIWQYLWRGGRGAIGNRGVAMYRNWLYVVTPDNFVVSLEAATGKERWKYKGELGVRASPCVHDGTVYVGDSSGVFHAIDARTGQKHHGATGGDDRPVDVNAAALLLGYFAAIHHDYRTTTVLRC